MDGDGGRGKALEVRVFTDNRRQGLALRAEFSRGANAGWGDTMGAQGMEFDSIR